ncbi:MAG: CpsB/CapC family capsule biosynthesis tyrosine phosphatase [Bacteroidales bacterium]|nr:CpsB/CapC family capsule biosynthesis tyrosine phosphatase [Bacteroidales bacterium]
MLDKKSDVHSHILYGVDDGVQQLEESLQILRELENLGIENLWCTPHIMEDIPNQTNFLQERFLQLKQAYKGKIQLHLAAEYMIDNVFNERLSNKDLLPHGELRNHLLVETSYFNPPLNLEETLQEIYSIGYYPLLAHPERYAYMEDNDYTRLKANGIKFQLNLLSLKGMYGKTAQKKAEWLLSKNYYDQVGSDIHSIHQIHALKDLLK